MWCLAALLLLWVAVCHGAGWTRLTRTPYMFDYEGSPGGSNNPILLTDGRVLVQNNNRQVGTTEMWLLTPDLYGSYVNGTWERAAPLPHGHNIKTFSSVVLPDGRVVFTGGEYVYDQETGAFRMAEFGKCSYYDPVSDVWTAFDGPSFFTDLPIFTANTRIGDSATVVLANGTLAMMCAPCQAIKMAYLDAHSMTWHQVFDYFPDNTHSKFDFAGEENPVLLPSGEILIVDAYSDWYYDQSKPLPASNMTNSELFNPTTGLWHSAGSTQTQMHNFGFFPRNSGQWVEPGGQILMPDGRVLSVGASGNVSLYDTSDHQWRTSAPLPLSNGTQLACVDCPQAVLPNGDIFMMANRRTDREGNYGLVFNGHDWSTLPLPADFYMSGMIPPSTENVGVVMLPSGEMYVTLNRRDSFVYSHFNLTLSDTWRPQIVLPPKMLVIGQTYQLTGRRFNGMTTGSQLSDDSQAPTNFPLVRLTHLLSGHVRYARTFNHSSMGVQTGDELVHTHVELSFRSRSSMAGECLLEVVANGIPSHGVVVSLLMPFI